MKVLELFAGAGGAALGLENAGCEHLACVEWDKDACATMTEAGLPAVQGDVRDLSLYEGMAPDLLWSSFPCQAWSTAGSRKGAEDDRNGWPWTVEAIDFTGPTWFVGENVVGLTNHKGACKGGRSCVGLPTCPNAYFNEVILEDLKKHFNWVDWRVLNSADYGVPQIRRRVFIIAGPHPIEWPEPTHQDPKKIQPGLFGAARRPWTTVRQALNLAAWSTATGLSGGGVPGVPRSPDTPSCQPVAGGKALGGLYGWDEVQLDGGRNSGSNPSQERPHSLNEPAPPVTGAGNHMLRLIGGGRNPQSKEVSHKRNYRDLTDEPCTTIPASQIGNAGPWLVAGTEPWQIDKPSPAVSASSECRGSGEGANPKKMQRASDALFLATGRRRLTIEECAKLMDFPDNYPFQGRTKQSRYRQVGNAVTPIVAQRLGEQIIKASKEN